MYAEILARHSHAIVDSGNAARDEGLYARLPLKPIVPHELRGNLDILPSLLRIEPDAPWFEELVDNLEEVAQGREDKRLISCLLDAPSDTKRDEDILMMQLTSRVLAYSHSTRRFLMRFYDPRVFPHLLRILRPVQLITLFGPIRTLSFLYGEECISHVPPEVAPGESIPAFWHVKPEQREWIDRIQWMNEVAGWYQMKYGDWPDYAAYAKTLAQIETAMSDATRLYGLTVLCDYQEFAWHSLQYGENFHLHLRMQDLLQELPLHELPEGGRRGYAEAALALEKQDWADIAASRDFYSYQPSRR